LSPSDGEQNRAKSEGKGRSHIEDLAFRNRPWREPDRLLSTVRLEFWNSS